MGLYPYTKSPIPLFVPSKFHLFLQRSSLSWPGGRRPPDPGAQTEGSA